MTLTLGLAAGCSAAALPSVAGAQTITYDVSAYYGSLPLAQGDFLYDVATATVTNISLGAFAGVPDGGYVPILTYIASGPYALEITVPSGEGGCPVTCGSHTGLDLSAPLGTQSPISIDGGYYAPDVGTGVDYLNCGLNVACTGTVTEVASSAAAAPEIDTADTIPAITMLLGWAAVMRGRRRRAL